MFAEQLRCIKCGEKYPLQNLYKCTTCGGILDVVYSFTEELSLVKDEKMQGIWKYFSQLPLLTKDNVISLGEGNTPLIPSLSFPETLNLKKVFFKLESSNPSGSFKDRGVAVAISKAKELCKDVVIVASTGNASASTASYAARARMKCIVCVPETTSIAKVSQAVAHGATVIFVSGNFSNSYSLALKASEKLGWVNTSTTFLNPYNLEGNKTIAYELFEQMEGNIPDCIVAPIGAGPLLVGIFKGFKELKRYGLISFIPRLIGIQAKVCSPIFQAYEERASKVTAWKKEFSTLAKGVADPLIGYEDDGSLTLQSILATGGSVEIIEEEEIRSSAIFLAEREGIYAEPTASISAAALFTLKKQNKIKNDEKIVCIITGHGLKDFVTVDFDPKIINTLKELEQYIEKI